MTNSPEPSQPDAASAAIQRSNGIDGNVNANVNNANVNGAPVGNPGPSETFTVDYNPDHEYAKDQLNAKSTSPPSVLPPADDDFLDTRTVQVPLLKVASAPALLVAIASTIVVLIGLSLNSFWLILAGSLIALAISLRLALPTLREILRDLTADQQALLISLPGIILGIYGIMQVSGINRQILVWGRSIRWDVVGALGDFLGALGQIFIAMLALYVAWRQFTISRDLTTQQNVITQQQTIDAYFQGISELVLDDEGLLEDWPQERIIAEARTAAILSSVDAAGKSKVLRFLSGSRLLTPLARDRRLGRPILDGTGGYAEDRMEGIRVIDLGVMLAAGDLANNDLRWVDLSGANLIRANLSGGNLVRANLSRTILCDATLTEADIMGTR
ncbi:MAG: pentapeptide repeat-containing protein, partial [Cyanobacteria bacterium P01_F01_bin.4]